MTDLQVALDELLDTHVYAIKLGRTNNAKVRVEIDSILAKYGYAVPPTWTIEIVFKDGMRLEV